jgi:nucleoside-diphosphate-sugar epimerase
VPTALVTGATGFVGSHIVDALHERGWAVRALVRATSDRRWLRNGNAVLVEGEVTNTSTLGAAVEGVDAIFHAAGVIKASREIDYRRVNVAGTENLVKAAAGRPRRFVLVSSVAAGGPSAPGRPRCEDDADLPQGPYGRSKHAAERALREGAGGMAWTILRPVAVYGPRDMSFLVLARLARRGFVPRIAGGKQPLHVIHVRDLVEAAMAAAESPAAAGRTYYLAHPEVTTWETLGTLMARASGKRPAPLIVPRGLVPGIGFVARAVGAPRGRNPLPRDRIRDLLAPAWTCDIARATAELGFTPRVGIREGIPELMDWYVGERFL